VNNERSSNADLTASQELQAYLKNNQCPPGNCKIKLLRAALDAKTHKNSSKPNSSISKLQSWYEISNDFNRLKPLKQMFKSSNPSLFILFRHGN